MSKREIQPVSILPSQHMLQELQAMYEYIDTDNYSAEEWERRRSAVMSDWISGNSELLREALLGTSVKVKGDVVEVSRDWKGGIFTTTIDIGDRDITDSVMLGLFHSKRWQVSFDKSSEVPDPDHDGYYPDIGGSEFGEFDRLEVLPKGQGLRMKNGLNPTGGNGVVRVYPNGRVTFRRQTSVVDRLIGWSSKPHTVRT